MRVLHIISSGGMYGAEAVILNLSHALNESSHSSVLGVFSNSSNPNLQLHNSALRDGIESNLISCNGQIDRTVAASIRDLVTRTKADVVHAHGYKADVYAYLALRGTTSPVVSTCHNWLKDNPLVSLYGVVDRFMLRNYDAVIAVSYEVRARLLNAGVPAEKIRFIRNGINLRPFAQTVPSLPVASDHAKGLTVGWIGRLSKEKGPDIFLRAAARVLIACPDTRFVMVGDGPDLAEINALIDQLAIRKNVFLAGRREDMPSVYASLEIMVSSSRQEGLPMAILEGMASGLALVATAVGEVPTVVLDGQTGVVVPSEDVESLAAGMITLLQDATLRKRFGNAALKLVEEQFSAQQMTREYLHVYSEVIAAKLAVRRSSLRSLASIDKSEAKKAGK
jgi:glycosyltransferase involved in cell wall biosynthesis